jgi:hypothetical protein
MATSRSEVVSTSWILLSVGRDEPFGSRTDRQLCDSVRTARALKGVKPAPRQAVPYGARYPYSWLVSDELDSTEVANIETGRGWGFGIWCGLLGGAILTVVTGIAVAVGSGLHSGQSFGSAAFFSLLIFWVWLPITVVGGLMGGLLPIIFAGPQRPLEPRQRMRFYGLFVGGCWAAATAFVFLLSQFLIVGIVSTLIMAVAGAIYGRQMALAVVKG